MCDDKPRFRDLAEQQYERRLAEQKANRSKAMAENQPKPRWLDKVPRCSSECQAQSDKCVQRIGEMGGESGAVCLPYVRQMAEENERLERDLATARSIIDDLVGGEPDVGEDVLRDAVKFAEGGSAVCTACTALVKKLGEAKESALKNAAANEQLHLELTAAKEEGECSDRLLEQIWVALGGKPGGYLWGGPGNIVERAANAKAKARRAGLEEAAKMVGSEDRYNSSIFSEYDFCKELAEDIRRLAEQDPDEGEQPTITETLDRLRETVGPAFDNINSREELLGLDTTSPDEQGGKEKDQ